MVDDSVDRRGGGLPRGDASVEAKKGRGSLNEQFYFKPRAGSLEPYLGWSD